MLSISFKVKELCPKSVDNPYHHHFFTCVMQLSATRVIPLKKNTFENILISALSKYSTASLNEKMKSFIWKQPPESLELKWGWGCLHSNLGSPVESIVRFFRGLKWLSAPPESNSCFLKSNCICFSQKQKITYWQNQE